MPERAVSATVIDPRRPWRLLAAHLREDPTRWKRRAGDILRGGQCCCLVTGAVHFTALVHGADHRKYPEQYGPAEKLASQEYHAAIVHFRRVNQLGGSVADFNDYRVLNFDMLMAAIDRAA